MTTVHVASNGSALGQDISIRQFQLTADEPPEIGGDDVGPAPTELLLASLGACKAITLRMYAARKGWDLQDVAVALASEQVGDRTLIQAELKVAGDLDTAQRQRLLEIADRCPVQRLLTGAVVVETRLVAAD